GVKFHMLHVLKGTRYESLFRAGLLSTYSLPEYTSDLISCIRALSPDVSVHRMTGDGRKADLVSPLWSGNKKHVLNELWRAFRAEDVRQGSYVGG
ncbi:MAG: TIGR01212 family radical SAM protein, partial [Clostridia bacterium]|nr:TIGR01212 family radical SAM protein [Clostridia bacterium]